MSTKPGPSLCIPAPPLVPNLPQLPDTELLGINNACHFLWRPSREIENYISHYGY